MSFKIFFTVDGVEDSFILSGESIEDIREQAAAEIVKRGLDAEKNGVWSMSWPA